MNKNWENVEEVREKWTDCQLSSPVLKVISSDNTGKQKLILITKVIVIITK